MKTSFMTLAATLAALLVFTNELPAQEGIWQTWSRDNSGLKSDTVMALTFDGSDSLWLATRYGVAKQSATGWVSQSAQMPSNDVWDMVYTQGNVWTGHRKGITGFDGATWTTYTVENSELVNAPVLCLAHDAAQNLWIGTARGMSRLSQNKTWATYTHETVPAIPYNGVQDIAVGTNGDIWFSMIGTKGIMYFPGGNAAMAKFIRQDTIPGMANDYLRCLAVDWSGNLWAGTRQHGVLRINAGGSTKFSKNIPQIKDSCVNAVAIDLCGNIWIGTNAGAAMYDGFTWTGFGTASGHLLNDTILKIEIDHAGHVWFGTKGGVTVFKPFPEAPMLITPLMNMTMNSDSVLCKWNWSCPNVSAYWYEIADNPQFQNAVIDTTSPSLMESATKLDIGLQNNTTYWWRVRARNDAGWGQFSPTWIFHVSYPSGVPMSEMMQNDCQMMQNYPNPCTDMTTISFFTSKHRQVSLKLYDMLGRECLTLVDGALGPGAYDIPLDVTRLPHNGVYIFCLEAGHQTLKRMMHVMR